MWSWICPGWDNPCTKIFRFSLWLFVAKQRDLSTAKAFIGMCSDMCPEKERYDREDKRRLSIFELAPASENIVCYVIIKPLDS